ncbi:MAG: hypothetical protein HY902_03265 [Deltaproteobacteria bacterium]|nr:hypothetical protein [Deltaproteobacteria bacterium]
MTTAAANDAPSHRRIAGWLALLAGLGTALARATPIYDPDYFWHLETGAWIAEHQSIPRVDPFSHTFAGKPWLYVDWLADLLMVGLYGAWDHAGNIAAFCAAAGVAVGLWTRHLAKLTASPWPLLAVSPLLVAATVFRVAPRPQTLTLLLLALVLALLVQPGGVDPQRAVRRAWWTVPLLVLCQNLHSSALLGWLALLAAAAGATVDHVWRPAIAPPTAAVRTRWLQVLAGALALLAAPWPVDRLAAGFLHLGDERVPAILMEWAPLWRDGWLPARSGWGAALGLLTLVALVPATVAPLRRQLPSAYWFLGLGFLVMGVRTARFVPMAAMALAPLAVVGLDAVFHSGPLARRRWALAAGAAVLGTVGVAAAAKHARPVGVGVAAGDFPEGAAEYLRRNPAKGNLYNDFFDGGFLLWALHRRYPVLIDGRAMALYGIDFVARVYDPPPGGLVQLLEEFRCGVAVVYNDQRLREVQARPDWRLVFLDDRAFVAVDRRANPALAARDGYQVVHPADLVLELSRWRADPSLAHAAQAEAERMVAAAPTAAMPKVVLATAQLALGQAAAARATTTQALEIKPDLLPALRTAATVCDADGDRACVCAFAAKVLRRAPHQAATRALAAKNRCGSGAEAPKESLD